ncbi:hypothetical protein STTU_5583 [Streptomyces sp. Tu6071]|nr:hypothetical protein STTU_5583 [Streptomyces sp. Tu6071]
MTREGPGQKGHGSTYPYPRRRNRGEPLIRGFASLMKGFPLSSLSKHHSLPEALRIS